MSGSRLKTLSGATAAVLSVAFTPDSSRIVSGCAAGAVRVWPVSTANTVATLRAPMGVGEIRAVDVSPGGDWVYAAQGPAVHVWDVATGVYLRGLAGCT